MSLTSTLVLFVSEDTPVETTGQLQIIIKPPMAQREEIRADQQVTNSAAESLIPTKEPREETKAENPEYVITKGIIAKLSKEIVAARKRKRTQQQQQGKVKRKLIIAESSDDEEELAATTIDIIEYASTKKVPIETQF